MIATCSGCGQIIEMYEQTRLLCIRCYRKDYYRRHKQKFNKKKYDDEQRQRERLEMLLAKLKSAYKTVVGAEASLKLRRRIELIEGALNDAPVKKRKYTKRRSK